MGLIGHEAAIDDLGQLALEAAQRFTRRLVLGDFALVMVSTEPRMHGLNAGGEVERGVERPVAVPRQAMPSDLSARHFDRRRAGVTGEAIRGGEAAYVAGVAEDLRSENLADPKDRRERRAACGDGTRAASPVLHEGPVDPPQVSHKLS